MKDFIAKFGISALLGLFFGVVGLAIVPVRTTNGKVLLILFVVSIVIVANFALQQLVKFLRNR